MPQLDEPSWETDLSGYGEYRTCVRPGLERIYKAVDKTDERGGVALPQRQKGREADVRGVVLLNGDQDGKKRFECVWQRHHESPRGELFFFA